MQLTIRDKQGRVWLPRQIQLVEVRYRPEHIEMALREAPAEAVVDGSIWCVLAGFDSERKAPGDVS